MTARVPAAVVAAAAFAAGCAAPWKKLPHDTLYQSAGEPTLHAKPATVGESLDWWDQALHTTVVPLGKLVSPARWLMLVTGGRPALDVNAFGKVPDSTWYENRLGGGALAPEDVRRGPNRVGGPADGTLTVLSGKTEGATTGVVLRDAEGTVWFVKFDPPAFPELTSGAEMVASRILWAAGYHVPETYLVDLEVERLDRAPDAWTRGEYDARVPLTDARFQELIASFNPDNEGRARALFSRQIPGEPIGPFAFRGVRADDPNDRIPHQRRRSLRGLLLLSAWINNTDTRAHNTLDTFIPVSEDGERGYVRHYLLDFGDALGAAGNRTKYIGEGYEYRVDWPQIFRRWITLGLSYPYWLQVRGSTLRSVGVFEAEVFDPRRWTPTLPNPAFNEATAEDLFWAASLIARLDRDHVASAVSAAEYSDPRAAELILDVLMKRREKILTWVFGRMLPIDDPACDGYVVSFVDLAERAGLRDQVEYEWHVRWNRSGRRDRTLARGLSSGPRVDLRAPLREILQGEPSAFRRDPFLTLTLRQAEVDGPRVVLQLRAVRDYLLPVALSREQE